MPNALRDNIPAWSLGDRLRKARQHAHLEQAALASAMGVSRNTVINYEADRFEPRKLVLNAWAMATGVPLEWLLTGAAQEETPAASAAGASQAVTHVTHTGEAAGQDVAMHNTVPYRALPGHGPARTARSNTSRRLALVWADGGTSRGMTHSGEDCLLSA